MSHVFVVIPFFFSTLEKERNDLAQHSQNQESQDDHGTHAMFVEADSTRSESDQKQQPTDKIQQDFTGKTKDGGSHNTHTHTHTHTHKCADWRGRTNKI